VLEAADHRRVKRATMDRRNAAARARRALGRHGASRAEGAALTVTLPGVVAWARPREQPLRGGGRRTAYPPAYEARRGHWRLVVAAAVAETGWVRPPVGEPLSVTVEVVAPGKHDLDRVVTAVLDALQGGGALVDDCRVWFLAANRRRPGRDEAARVDVLLMTAGAGAC
jgi:hypothetical protein